VEGEEAMSGKRVSYPPEMKAQAVKDVLAGSAPAKVAKMIGCHVTSVTNWVKASTKKGSVVVRKGSKVRVGHSTHDAIVYLRHAKDAMKVQLVQDPGRFDDPVYLFAMLALATLEGRA